MAEITRRRTGELLRGVFEILMPHSDGLPGAQCLVALEKRVPPTPFEEGNFPSGGRRYEKIVRFATVDAVKAGWLMKVHGKWILLDEGRAAYAQYPDPEAFYRRAFQLYQEWRKNTPSKSDAAAVSEQSEDPVIEETSSLTFEVAEELAWKDIERHLTTMLPYEFQDLVAALLRGMGYHVGWVAPKGKDGGVDITAYNDPLGTRPPRIKVQVKRQQQRVTVDGLRSFMAVLSHDDVGIFVNSGGFTKDAEDEARTQPSRRVTLLDLEKLVALWVEHYRKIDEKDRRLLPLEPIYFLAPQG